MVQSYYSLVYILLGLLIFLIVKIASDKNFINRSLYVRYTDSIFELKTVKLDINVINKSVLSARKSLDNESVIKLLSPKLNEIKEFLAFEMEPRLGKNISKEEVGYILCVINPGLILYKGIVSEVELMYKDILQRIIYDKALIDDRIKLNKNMRDLAKKNEIIPVQEFSQKAMINTLISKSSICTFNEIQLKDIKNKQNIYAKGNGLFSLLNDMDMIKWFDASQP